MYWSLTHVFNSTTRQQLIDFILGFIEVMEIEHVLEDSDEPFFISIDGDGNAGKTLIWDVGVDTLLGGTKTLIPEKSKIVQRDGIPELNISPHTQRLFETYEGISQRTAEHLRILCLNLIAVGGSGKHSKEKRISDIEKRYPYLNNDKTSTNLKRLGDILLLSNGTLKHTDVNMMLTYKGRWDATKWNRELRIAIKNPELQQSEALNEYLDATCEAL